MFQPIDVIFIRAWLWQLLGCIHAETRCVKNKTVQQNPTTSSGNWTHNTLWWHEEERKRNVSVGVDSSWDCQTCLGFASMSPLIGLWLPEATQSLRAMVMSSRCHGHWFPLGLLGFFFLGLSYVYPFTKVLSMVQKLSMQNITCIFQLYVCIKCKHTRTGVQLL